MSEDISRLPPQIQQRLLRLQQLQQSLQGVMAQKQQLELQLNEVEQALTELEKLDETAIIYKSIGALLIKSKKGIAFRQNLKKGGTETFGPKESINVKIKSRIKNIVVTSQLSNFFLLKREQIHNTIDPIPIIDAMRPQ